MKSAIRLIAAVSLCFLIGNAPGSAVAQSQVAAASESLKPAELSQLVAPIALYPDTLLSQVLIASTYPLEVVQADRWASANKTLTGSDLQSAVDRQAWDDSVKSLTATPTVLSIMSSKLEWTQKLGDSVLAQQADVMDAIQQLRTRASAEKKLTSTKQQTVSVKREGNRQAIVIEPAQPDMIYVPYYDPAVAYGGWPYSDYPPYYFPAPGYIGGAVLATGIAFAAGVAVGAWATRGNYWGGGVNWGGNSINVNRPININNTPINNWTHKPEHRHGVAYNNANVANKFAGNNIRGDAQNRVDFRGRNGEQVLQPGGDRPSVASRESGNRPNAGDRKPANKKAGGNTASNRAASARPPGASANRAGRDSAFSNVESGRAANAASARGHASLGGARASQPRVASSGHAGGGGFRGGGGGGRGRR